jgi:CHAT domain-containing protein
MPGLSVTSERRRRRGIGVWWLAVPVMLLAGLFGWTRWPAGSSSPDRPELQGLAAALARQPNRPIDGRLSGAFAYSPMPVPTRGAASADVAPEVLMAVALIQKTARAVETPVNLAALGIAHLVSRDPDRATEFLEAAVDADPENPTFLNDLAASYLARAVAREQPEDYARSLAMAARAIVRDPQRAEPYFNRALALGGLRLALEEQDAWKAYTAIDPRSPWARESLQRLRGLEARQEQRNAGSADLDRQALRQEIEDRLLPEWGSAVERGDATAAAQRLGDAAMAARRLADAGGDVMVRDEVKRIGTIADRSRLMALARGHRLLGDGRALWQAERFADALPIMAEAERLLRRAGSPYAFWPAVYDALLRRTTDGPAAIARLGTVPLDALPANYYHLRGRAGWAMALAQQAAGRFDRARDVMRPAVAAFQAAGESDHIVVTRALLAEAEWYLGDQASAWANLAAALTQADRNGTTGRIEHLDLASTISLGTGLPEAALAFQNALVRLVQVPRARAELYARRARTRVRLGDTSGAARDLELAAAALETVPDRSFHARVLGDVEAIAAELHSGTDCPRALHHAEAALSHFGTGRVLRRAALLTVRAGCRTRIGDADGARADLLQAVSLFESMRAQIASVADRVQAFELERRSFGELIRLDVVDAGDQGAALQTAERARAGVLAERWHTGANPPVDHRRLPASVAVVYFETLSDRVLVWALTRERSLAWSRPLAEADVSRAVSRIQRAIQQGADLGGLRVVSGPLFDQLIAPALAAVDTAGVVPTVVFVPDGPLFALPFGALPDASGQPLIATRVVAVAPSLATFLAASERLRRFAPASVLAVGDGHDPRTTGLPMLPRADDEAASVGRLYRRRTVLPGTEATRRRLLAGRASVVHFAGHSVLNDRYPMFSRLLLAPEPAAGDEGWLLGSDIASLDYAATGVVMLATCEGAAGRPIEGEGAISVARAFFGAGVPAVVASLWPVDDDLQTLVMTFHRTLVAGRDAAAALRAGQLALLAERGPQTPVRVWGGFIMLGGLTPAEDEV